MTMATSRTSGQLRMITMRDFRAEFAKLTEPVKVIRVRGNVEVIGTWTPAQNTKVNKEAK